MTMKHSAQVKLKWCCLEQTQHHQSARCQPEPSLHILQSSEILLPTYLLRRKNPKLQRMFRELRWNRSLDQFRRLRCTGSREHGISPLSIAACRFDNSISRYSLAAR